MKLEIPKGIKKIKIIDSHQLVYIESSGDVVVKNFTTNETTILFTIDSTKGIQYTDGGFDLESPLSIYSMDEIIVIVNDYKTHGFLYNSGYSSVIRFQREDYYAEISKFPIALFKKDDKPYMIYSTAWNRVDVIDLNTREILTADKSLILKSAEEDHKKFAQDCPKYDTGLWPSSFDYFYGSLEVSRDGYHFLSNGWVWGSSDSLAVLNIDEFIESNRVSLTHQNFFEHEDRPSCFMGSDTIASLYNPLTEDCDKNENEYRLRFYNFKTEKENYITVPLNIDKFSSEKIDLYYIRDFFVLIQKNTHLLLFNKDGTILKHQENLNIQDFNVETLTYIAEDNQEFYLKTLI